jgi:cysteine-rich repeat protein
MDDGVSCGRAGLICLGGECVSSTCGDGFVDVAAGEVCDDGNDIAFDGCEPSCVFTCVEDAECDDGVACNGAETCGETNACEAGEPLAAGTACSTDDVPDGVCRAGACVSAGCGNSVVDGDEQCDDGNEMDGDGCDVDCTFSCEAAADCDDGSVCTGEESCDPETHACVEGTPLECMDSSPCTEDSCDPTEGCVFPLIDMDGDGQASTDLGACGTDCNDMRDDVYDGAPELCDGIDHDCDGDPMPAESPLWYLDCDGDGYAPLGAPSMRRCDEPAPQGCGGGWTTRIPVTGDPSTSDCNDADADANPAQTSYFTSQTTGGGFDYNCNGMIDYRYATATNVPESGSCSLFCTTFGSCFCIGSDGWTGSSAPSCGGTGRYSDCTQLCIRGGSCSCTRIVTSSRRQECR